MTNEEIKNLRYKMYLTQAEFGKLLGVTEQTVRAWELNKKNPHLRNQKKLLDLCKKENIKIKG